MRKIMVAGNWKMNKTIAEGVQFIKDLAPQLSAQVDQIDIVVAPTFTALASVAQAANATPIKIAAQNMYCEASGAFTGEIAPQMIEDAGAQYVILGHSERRQLFHENNELINRKLLAALKQQLIPILCIGETLQEREAGLVTKIVTSQLQEGLAGCSAEQATQVVIAYEPVWAIGTGKTATPTEAEAVHLTIRQCLAELFGSNCAESMQILYGGSVKPANSLELFQQPNIDGALIGGASLKPADFAAIIQTATQL